MSKPWDVIVVGARCGGSPLAMLLARAGYRVLVVDRAAFPSDTMSSHFLHPPAVAALSRWGLLGDLASTGCPPIERYRVDFGPFAIEGAPRPADGIATAYGPRRSVLDAILVEAAARAGAEIRQEFTVEEILFDGERVAGIRGHEKIGPSVIESARVVVGADGMHSIVARATAAPAYNEKPTFAATYYTYFSDIPVEGFEIYVRPGRSWGAFRTHSGLTCIPMSFPRGEFAEVKKDIDRWYRATFDLVPAFAERVAAGTRVERYVGTGDAPGFFRKPYGPGWALVGDAAYHKDPCTAQGISDAFRDAGRLARALDDVFARGVSFDAALAAYERDRNEHVAPLYEFTCGLATQEPPPPETARVLAASAGNPEAMRDFLGILAGTVSPASFFAPDNVARITAAASAAMPG